MTYQIKKHDDAWELRDSDGNTVTTGEYPLTTPDDIIDAILDDMRVGNPQQEAFAVLFNRDWEFDDE